jgi:putative membrane protein
MTPTVLAPVAPETVWTAWTFDPLVVLALVGSAVLYAIGYRRLRGRGRRPWRAVAFGGAWLAIAIALVTPLDAMARALFSAHMVQHLLLIVVAAPLLVVGRPVRSMLAGLPRETRRSLTRLGAEISRSAIARTLRRPAVAWSVFAIGLWAWHLPVLYDAAVLNPALHALEHLTFLGTSMLTWAVALEPRHKEALGRALFLVACSVQSGALGALLLFASSPLYPVHGVGPSLWGLTPLRDQQLAGAIMWIPPSAVYLVAAAAVLVRWFRWMDRRDAREAERREHGRLEVPA